MATHSSTLAWKIPWTEEPHRLKSMGSLRVGHDWATSLFIFHFHALEKEMASHSSVLAWRIPGTAEPGGLPSTGSHRVRHDWSDLAAATTTLLASLLSISIWNSFLHNGRARTLSLTTGPWWSNGRIQWSHWRSLTSISGQEWKSCFKLL